MLRKKLDAQVRTPDWARQPENFQLAIAHHAAVAMGCAAGALGRGSCSAMFKGALPLEYVTQHL